MSQIHITTSRNLPPSNIVSSSDRTTGTTLPPPRPSRLTSHPPSQIPHFPAPRQIASALAVSVMSHAVSTRHNTGAAGTTEAVVRRRGPGAGEPSRSMRAGRCDTLPPGALLGWARPGLPPSAWALSRARALGGRGGIPNRAIRGGLR